MPNQIRNIIALMVAIMAAAMITFLIITFGHAIIPPPDLIDTNDFESIKSNFHLFQTKHFIFPLLAHAMGTLVAAFLVALLAANHQFRLALGIGVLFMLASLWLAFRIGHFNWIGVVEIMQYIPFSILGYRLWRRMDEKRSKKV